jgi:hypothetical protein
MKYLIISVLLFVAIIRCISQNEPMLLIQMGYSFDDINIMWPDTYYCEIDTLNVNNIWQIGIPNKQYFNSAFSVPNAIVTDLNYTYPPNNHSTFQFSFKKPAPYFNWINMRLQFIHKFDTDSLYDGGYVEISYDGGQTWTNIINDTNPGGINTAPFYSANDTIIGGIPAFTGRSNNWQVASLMSLWSYENSFTVDSCVIRFNFISDSIDNGREGWMIDDIWFEVYYYFDDISEYNDMKEVTIFPNPLTETSVFIINNRNKEKYYIIIYDALGIEMLHSVVNDGYFQIGRYKFDKGVYFYKLIGDERKYSGRFMVK